MSMPPDSQETISACRALFLQRLGALIQESGVLSGPAIKAIQQGASAYFDSVIAGKRRNSFHQEVDGLTSSRLTLVGEDELELEIRLENLSSRLFQETGGDLWKIHLRFITLLKRPDLSKTSNPVGPNAIGQGLEEMFVAAGASSLDKKLDLLERIEVKLLEKLPQLYVEIDDLLAGHGTEAAQPSIITTAESNAQKNAAASERTLLALQQALLSRMPSLPQANSGGDGYGGSGVGSGSSGGGSGGAVASLLSQATLERLIFRLDELDRQGQFMPTFKAGTSPQLEMLIPGLFAEAEAHPVSQPKSLSAAELGIPAMAPEALAIDTLAMIFETIFDHPALPDALKAVISSLQITMLKLAMQDAAFFTDASHPARLLLDKMGLAMLGLPVDVSARHPICKQLFEIAGQLRSQFSGDIAVFRTALEQVEQLIAEQNASIAKNAEPYIEMLQQFDARDQAAFESRLALDKLTVGLVPGPVREFLDDTWQKVLQLVWTESGPESSQWQAHKDVIHDLLWTFQPKAVAEDRKALAKRLPEILKLLKSGMDRVGMPAEAQAAFLDVSFALQTQALRTSQAASPMGSVDVEADAPSEVRGKLPAAGEAVVGELRSGDKLLCTLGFIGNYSAPLYPLACQPGDWLQFSQKDGETAVARFCYITPNNQWALLYNPETGLALAIHSVILEKQFSDAIAHVCSSISLFDAAANRALQRTVKS